MPWPSQTTCLPSPPMRGALRPGSVWLSSLAIGNIQKNVIFLKFTRWKCQITVTQKPDKKQCESPTQRPASPCLCPSPHRHWNNPSQVDPSPASQGGSPRKEESRANCSHHHCGLYTLSQRSPQLLSIFHPWVSVAGEGEDPTAWGRAWKSPRICESLFTLNNCVYLTLSSLIYQCWF